MTRLPDDSALDRLLRAAAEEPEVGTPDIDLGKYRLVTEIGRGGMAVVWPIARANRVFPEKENGLIVDYVGVFRNLERTLAIYGSGTDGGLEEGEMPVKDKSELVAQLKAAITEAEAFCDLHGINLKAIGAATGFERVSLLDNAVEALLASDETKRQYLALAGQQRRSR